MNNYNYLKKYISLPKDNSLKIRNAFYPVKQEDIKQTEELLKIKFPSQLSQFYQDIGYGFLVCPENISEDYTFHNINRINSPSIIKEILLNGYESGLISRNAYEDLQPGDLPFFEIGDSSSFMIMKLNSDNPNAVWFMGQEKIEDSFEKFIWNLYYDNPAYYTKRW